MWRRWRRCRSLHRGWGSLDQHGERASSSSGACSGSCLGRNTPLTGRAQVAGGGGRGGVGAGGAGGAGVGGGALQGAGLACEERAEEGQRGPGPSPRSDPSRRTGCTRGGGGGVDGTAEGAGRAGRTTQGCACPRFERAGGAGRAGSAGQEAAGDGEDAGAGGAGGGSWWPADRQGAVPILPRRNRCPAGGHARGCGHRRGDATTCGVLPIAKHSKLPPSCTARRGSTH